MIKGIGSFQHFFTINNIRSCIKAFSTNYEPVFIELKNLYQLLRYCNFCKQVYRLYGLKGGHLKKSFGNPDLIP